MNSIEGRWLDIRCYKHNGTIHRFWDRGLVLENNDDYLIVATKRAKVVENNGRCWFTKEPAVTIFSKKEWWNVICMLKDDGICYYCNIASPALINSRMIKYIGRNENNITDINDKNLFGINYTKKNIKVKKILKRNKSNHLYFLKDNRFLNIISPPNYLHYKNMKFL